LEECGPCPIFASFTLALALQLREKHGKISFRVAEESCLKRIKEGLSRENRDERDPYASHSVGKDLSVNFVMGAVVLLVMMIQMSHLLRSCIL
jgi:hypothetical protein